MIRGVTAAVIGAVLVTIIWSILFRSWAIRGAPLGAIAGFVSGYLIKARKRSPLTLVGADAP